MKKSRENFEYRVAQPSREIKDFLEFIKYERSLISLTKERVKLQKITQNNTIGKLIAQRMKQLYTQALSKFPQDTRFWDEYIKFLQQFKFSSDVSSTFDRMLQFHGDKPDVWIRAILWEYNENYQDHRVKGLLLRAQQRHPESQKLYLTFFQIELENKRKADESLALQHADVVYSNGKKKFTNIEYFIEMLNIVDKFGYAKSIQQTILDDMRRLFPRHELLWHTLAQRELNGLSPGDCTTDITESVKREGADARKSHGKVADPSASVTHTLKKRIELCVQIYDAAVKEVDTTQMWDYYLNAMLELNSDLATQASIKRHLLSRAFRAANESNNMSEDHYLQYVEMLYANDPKDDNIARVLNKSTTKFSNSLKVWMQCMRYYIQENNFKKTQEVFQKAKKHLGANGQELWQLYLIYLKTHQTNEANQEFEHLVHEVSCQPLPAFNVFKAKILELLATTANIKRARKTYQLFIKNFPNCYEVHEMMADLESKQVNERRPSPSTGTRLIHSGFSFFPFADETRRQIGTELPRNANTEFRQGEDGRVASLHAIRAFGGRTEKCQ